MDRSMGNHYASETCWCVAARIVDAIGSGGGLKQIKQIGKSELLSFLAWLKLSAADMAGVSGCGGSMLLR